MRAHAGTLRPEDAHQLFDEMLHQATPVPKHSLNGFLAAVARAPASDACRDGLALAVALFNRVCGEEAACPQVPPFTDQTYCTLVECCCRDRRPDLALAFFGRFLKTGLKSEELVANTLHRCLPLSTSAFWSPIAAFSAATERVRAGMLTPEDAHHLFDRWLAQPIPVAQRFLNRFLATLARAPSVREGPALAVALFNRLYREEGGLQVAPVSIHTYNIIMDSCCRASRADLGLAIFGRFLRTGMRTNQNTANAFLKCLCYAKRTDEAVDVLLHRMSKLGCAPDPFSYSIVAKGLCDDGRSQQALDLLQMVVKEGGACSLDVVVYDTVIHGLCNEGQVSKACNLFHEMMEQGVMPTVLTYTSIIDGLCNARVMDKAELFLRQMVDSGVQPNKSTYYSMVHGYSSLGQRKEAGKMFQEMISRGLCPNIVTSTR
jgi:pentatricopeptide repeat protein